MRRLLFASLLLAAPALAQEPAAPLSPKLQTALRGRIAGTPVDCINLPRIRSSTIIDKTAIIYKESPRRWYVNRPAAGCPLDPKRALVTRIPSTRLCRMDLVGIVDLPLHFNYGACALGDFVPYTR